MAIVTNMAEITQQIRILFAGVHFMQQCAWTHLDEAHEPISVMWKIILYAFVYKSNELVFTMVIIVTT